VGIGSFRQCKRWDRSPLRWIVVYEGALRLFSWKVQIETIYSSNDDEANEKYRGGNSASFAEMSRAPGRK